MVMRGVRNTDFTDDSDDITTWGEWYRVQSQGIRGQRVEKFRRDCTDQHGRQVDKTFKWVPSL